jgi:hypothetical protein
LIEAGFVPNEWQAPTDTRELVEQYALLAKELGRLPVNAELKLKRRNDRRFPSEGTYRERFSNKLELIRAVAEFCTTADAFKDVAIWCDVYRNSVSDAMAATEKAVEDLSIGFVYLAKSGRHYKIGKSNAAGRREYEIGLQLPEKLKTLHVISTDDPTGIEAYWHKRFEAKRKNGEWFDLDRTDVSAFKRRKFM